MVKKSDDMSMEDAVRLAKSDVGRQLFAALKAQNAETMNQAMADAASGDYAKVRQNLQAMLASPQIQTLMEQLRGQSDG